MANSTESAGNFESQIFIVKRNPTRSSNIGHNIVNYLFQAAGIKPNVRNICTTRLDRIPLSV
jgi:hypothetical protein